MEFEPGAAMSRERTRTERSFETLERRDLLTGSVTVNLIGSTLIITGGRSDTTVQVTLDGQGDFVVKADQATAGRGALQQDNAGQVTVTGKVQNVTINMHGGHDTVGVAGTFDSQTLTLTTPLVIAGRLSINTGKGSSYVAMGGLTVGGTTSIRSTSGVHDTNLLEVLGGTFKGAFSANLGNGGNVAVFSYTQLINLPVEFDSSFSYRGGRGEDLFATAGTSEFKGSVLVDLQGGDDVAAIGNSTFDSGVTVLGGTGHDAYGFFPSQTPTYLDPQHTKFLSFESNSLPPL
jgi:hypothetical protein